MSTAAEGREALTLPRLAVMINVPLDKVRREFRRRPELAGLTRTAGNAKFIDESAVGFVAEQLGGRVPVGGVG